MSLESKIVLLIEALEANTAAITGNVPKTAPVVAPVVTTAAPAPATAAPVQPAPVVVPAAPVTQPAAAQPVAASPSETTPPVTNLNQGLEQLQQEVTAVYQKLNGDPRVMQTVNQYGASLSTIPVEQYANLIAAVRAL